VPRSKPPRRCQAAEETRGPRAGAHRRGEEPRQESFPRAPIPDPLAVNAQRLCLGPRRPGRGLALWLRAKRPQGWVQCEDRLPYYNFIYWLLDSTRLHDARGPRRSAGAPGAQGPGPARVGRLLLGASMQREGAVPDSSVQNKMTRIASLD
jgi:hypothetical protein